MHTIWRPRTNPISGLTWYDAILVSDREDFGLTDTDVRRIIGKLKKRTPKPIGPTNGKEG